MSIHFQINIEGETTDEAIAEFRKVFGGLLGAPAGVTGPDLYAGVEANLKAQGDGERVVGKHPALGAPYGEAAPKKTRNKKDKAPEVIDNTPLPAASNAEKTESASTSSTTETSSTSASDVSSVSIDDLRAKLMSLSKTDGGHDKVFTILGKFGAKNASTVPEDKRGEVVALVDEALAGAK